MTIVDSSLLFSAAFLASIINSIAGGGSFITFPALVFTGVPTIAANATSSVAVFPGYLSSAFGFFKELKNYPRKQMVMLLSLALLGGVLGSFLLLATSDAVFSHFVPWLLAFATIAFAFGKRVADWSEKNVDADGITGKLATLFVCIYGGYFNGGLGIILLALFSALGMRDLNLINGLKNCVSFVLSSASVVIFSVAGIVYWPQALVMMVGATIGGYCGAHVARRLSVGAVRIIVVCIGITMTILFALRG